MKIHLKSFEIPLVCLWAIVVVCFAYSFIALDPGHILMAKEGDGIKNYFTFLYHSLYEKGLWFHGMNYPYGEHIVFTDVQPLLSSLFIFTRHTGGWNTNDALALMHLSICFSSGLAILFNFRILRLYQLPFLICLLAATCIALLSPQVLRVSGHFSLAYPSFTAMLFYFTLRYDHSLQWKYVLYLFLLGTVMYFLHPYYIALSGIWIIFYSISRYLIRSGNTVSTVTLQLIPLWVMLILMFSIVKIFMSLTDPVKDRPEFPHGAMAYGATGDEIFTSAYSPLWEFAFKHSFVSEPCSGGEGFAYLGIVCIIVIGISLVCMLLQRIRKQQKNRHTTLRTDDFPFPSYWMLMALFLLLFGMGVPFVWNMEWLLNYLSMFRQFRSLGRFIWLFYQLITILSVLILYQYYRRQHLSGKKWAPLVLIVPFCIWTIEAWGYTEHLRSVAGTAQNNYETYFEKDKHKLSVLLKQYNKKETDFQAIIFLPFVHIGSEKWSVHNSESGLLHLAFRASLETRLPVTDVMMSRTSWAQTAAQVRIAGGRFTDKPLFRQKSAKPFLLLLAHTDQPDPDELELLASADLLGDWEHCAVYCLYPEKLLAAEQESRQHILSVAESMAGTDTIINNQGAYVLINHLDGQSNKNVLWGAGALGKIQARDSLLASIAVHPEQDNQVYEISSWVLVSARDFRTPVFNLSMLDEQGNEIYRKDALAKESTDNQGLWLRVHQYFVLPKNCRTLRWHLYDDDKKTYLALDEIQLRPVGTTIISKQDNAAIMVNNHLLKK